VKGYFVSIYHPQTGCRGLQGSPRAVAPTGRHACKSLNIFIVLYKQLFLIYCFTKHQNEAQTYEDATGNVST
jgi:hypothetical protein